MFGGFLSLILDSVPHATLLCKAAQGAGETGGGRVQNRTAAKPVHYHFATRPYPAGVGVLL